MKWIDIEFYEYREGVLSKKVIFGFSFFLPSQEQ